MGIIVFLLNADGDWNANRLLCLFTLPPPPPFRLHVDTAVEMPTTCVVVVIIR
jgi:hypothetical protein